MTDSVTSFAAFHLDDTLNRAIAKMGYAIPTPIQVKAIPLVLAGCDVMGAAQTGTGKTAGFGLPALQRILPTQNISASPARHPVRVLILTPTRELADQINVNMKAYASETALRVSVVYGGVDMKPQTMELTRGVEVLTATPGRLLDHVEGRTVNLSQVEIVILDEADRMLDMGFLPDISRILALLPKKRQSLMFSATFSPEIKKLAKNFLTNPKYVEVARQNAVADTVEQVLFKVHDSKKQDALIEILSGRVDSIAEAVLEQVLVFVNAKITCRRLARTLQNAGFKADSIHGDKTQEERTATLTAFKNGECEVLVATDVAARGLDIAELPFVINYDVPFAAEDYVHRIGRTGRAGVKGFAVMFATGGESGLVDAIEKLTKQTFKTVEFEPETRERYGSRRGERHLRREDHDHEGRLRPEVKSYAKVAYDPIFDKPYEPSGYTGDTKKEAEAKPLSHTKKKKGPVSALLCGLH